MNGAPLTEEEIRSEYGQAFPDMFFVSARTGDCIPELFQEAGTLAMNWGKAETDRKQANIRNDGTTDSGCSC
jgi:hypothetical protein